MSDAADTLTAWSEEQLLRAERWIGRWVFAKPFLNQDRRMLFVLGHMRTGSTLLVHILTSNPQILGFGETHNVYSKYEDFGATTAMVCRRTRQTPDPQSIVLDKVLHQYQFPRETVLDHPSVRVIFMMRRPDHALSSMVQHNCSADFAQAYAHYMEQIEWIEETTRVLSPEQWTCLTYADLLQDTAAVFRRLERFLALDEPLKESYQTTRYTGVSGIGDPGTHIDTGHIKRNIDRDVDPRVQPFLDSAGSRFRACREMLQAHHIW